MTITAKFPGTCKKCGEPISVGEKIEWERGAGASHVQCQSVSGAEKSEPVVYQYTNGYAGSFGVEYDPIDGDELEKKIALAAEHNKCSADKIRQALDDGYRVLTGEKSPNHYYDHGMAKIRRRPASRPRPERKWMTCKRCGQTGPLGGHPFSTAPSSGLCDDCF